MEKLENRISVLVILEAEQLQTLDKEAGVGKRSEYLRYLVDTIDGSEAKKFIEANERIRSLEKIPELQAKKIVDLQLKVQQLKDINRHLVSGKPLNLGEIQGVPEAIERHRAWINGLLERKIEVRRGLEKDRLGMTAKALGVPVDELLSHIHQQLGISGIDVNKLTQPIGGV